jgi:hypothetical protein
MPSMSSRTHSSSGWSYQKPSGLDWAMETIRSTRRKEIDVTGETGIAMKDYGLAAYDQIMDLIFFEQPDKFQDVIGEGVRIYLAT